MLILLLLLDSITSELEVPLASFLLLVELVELERVVDFFANNPDLLLAERAHIPLGQQCVFQTTLLLASSWLRTLFLFMLVVID